MNDKRKTRLEIVTWLCGDENLSEKFIRLLEAGGLSENDGKAIREELLGEIDSNYNMDLIFDDSYRKRLQNPADYPADEMNEYTSDEEYRTLLNRHFPQNVEEACDVIIGMLDEDEIMEIKESDKFMFGISQHFGLGLFVRNHFGINQGLSPSLSHDIREKSGEMMFMRDDMSGYILDEVWEEIQRRC